MGRKSYQTWQREAVLACLRQRPDRCLSAAELQALLAAEGRSLSLSTVYRVLERLDGEDLTLAYPPQRAGESLRYQYKGCRQPHLHLRCWRCGALTHLTCRQAEALAGHLLSEHAFKLSAAQTVLSGLCGACQQKGDGDEEA